jgi:FtsZ-binding cell division protein ZapB
MNQLTEIEERRKKRRKQTAEVFTPIWLAQQMIDKLPEECWIDPTKTALEPACGNGVFIELMILKKLEFGSTIKQAVETIYGIDLMPDNVEETKQKVKTLILKHRGDESLFHIVERNIKCGDALKVDFDEIFK